MKKNRYRNIVPYDTHRVPLGLKNSRKISKFSKKKFSKISEKNFQKFQKKIFKNFKKKISKFFLGPNGDYINASYVKHYDQKSNKRYISTQGPLPNTITDFWRMIYDEVKFFEVLTLISDKIFFQCSPVIVMTALTVETARKKCEVWTVR